MIAKKELASAIVKFISNDLIGDITDKHLKFSLCMAKEALTNNPDVIDGFLESPVVANIVKECDGEYDVMAFGKTLKNVLSCYESFPIVIPAIPMFAPKENVIKITSADIDKLLLYVQNTDEE